MACVPGCAFFSSMLLSTVTCFITGASGLSVGDSAVSAPPRGGVQLVMCEPIGTYTNPSRRTGLAAVSDWAVSDGIIASSRGRATVAPMPRKNVRRASAFFVMIMMLSCSGMACC